MDGHPDWEVIESGPRDLERVGAALTAAFADDPFVTWLLGGKSRYQRRARTFYRALIGRSVRNGWTDLLVPTGSGPDAEAVGVAVWHPPGVRTTLSDHLATTPDLFRAFGSRLLLAALVEARTAKYNPGEPHWYLGFAGVVPGAAGQGLGSTLLEKGLERADSQGHPVHLESSNPRNIPFYERLGFVRGDTIRVLPGAPEETTMSRRAGRDR